MLNLILTPMRVLLFSFAVFAVFRLVYLFAYQDYFASLALFEIGKSFLVGLRFDAAITTVAVALFFLPLILPFNFKARVGAIKVLLWFVFSVLVCLWAISLGDLLYFGEVYRHAGRELLLVTQDLGMFFELAVSSRAFVVFLALPCVVLLAWLWHRWVIKPSAVKLSGSLISRSCFSFLALLLLVLSARGGVLTSKPISLVDASEAGNEQQAALALNGAFAVIHGMRRGLKDGQTPLNFYTPDALTQKSLDYLLLGEDPFISSLGTESPLTKDKNVVIVLLESWSSEYIDGLSGGNYGVTPNMDKLISKARVWENAYAAGQRSIEGIQAVLTSVPLLESQPVVGWGLEQNRMTRLASLLGERGYQSVMMQSSNRRSFHMDGIAAAMGFDAYFGKEDLEPRLDYPGDIPSLWVGL